MRKRIGILLCVGLLGAAMVFGGCSKKEEGAAEATPTPTETPAETPVPLETSTPTPTETPALKTIGTKTEKAYEIQLKNATGMAITGLTIKSSEETEYPANLLAEGDSFAANEERLLYYEIAAEATETPAETADAQEKALEPAYDIQLTFEGDMVLVLHAFPFGDMEKGEIYAEDSVAFLKYQSVATKEQVDTKEAELAVLAAETAAQTASEPVYEEPVYEEPSYEEPVYEEPVYEEPYYEEPVYEEPVYEEPSYEEPVYEEPDYSDSSSGGSDDSCLDGGLLY